MRHSVLVAMHTLLACGVSVVPIRPDGSKAALVPWQPYQQRRATDGEVDAWGRRFAHQDAGLAIVAGPVSGHVEVLDFDAIDVVEPWAAMVETIQPRLVDSLVAVRTPRPGMSLWYRCPALAGNQKLAEALEPDGTKKTLIETRGRGGYALIPPSPAACHATLRPYQIVRGTLRRIPEITAQSRDVLLNVAKLFHTAGPIPERKTHVVQRHPLDGDRPGDLYNAWVCWHEVLEPHGWVAVSRSGPLLSWRRPGKPRGVSATSGLTDHDLLYIFSSNAAPFEPGCCYSKFSAYSYLNHGGDMSRASQQLRLDGYRRSRFTAHPTGVVNMPPRQH